MPALIGAVVKVAWTALTAVGLSGAVADALISFAGSLLLNAASAAMQRAGIRQADVKRELSQPTEKPAYRFVYGRDLAAGSPAPYRVRGSKMIGCWILNSRPSHGNFTLYLDKRVVALDGDAYDFGEGGGAVATNDPFFVGPSYNHVTVWFGRGDQTSPPWGVLDVAPWAEGADEELFKPSDGWQGRTVVWLILDAGGAGEMSDRWPSPLPLVEVEGDYALVWDINDPAQDPDDPATRTYSNNHALCILDAARMNPIKPYQLQNLLLDSFRAAALVSDEPVALKAGGTEPRYAINGTILWQAAELEDQLGPMFVAGAASAIRAGGRLGIAPGVWQEPGYVLTDILEGGFEMVGTQGGDSLPTQLRVSYTSAARLYEDAELAPWDIPGALAADGGIPSVKDLDLALAGSPTQAMRVRKIAGLKARRQRRFTLIAPPSAFDLIAGAMLTADLPTPWSRWNASYEVEATHPGMDIAEEQGGAMRCQLQLVRSGPEIFAWDPATDEEVIESAVFDPARAVIAPPGIITAVTGPGVDLDTGGSVLPRIRFTFARRGAMDPNDYEWEYRVDGGEWYSGGWIAGWSLADGIWSGLSGTASAYLTPVAIGSLYDIRVRTVAARGKSAWRTVTGISIGLAVTGTAALAGLGHARFTGMAPATLNCDGVRIYRSPTLVFADAVPASAKLPVTAGAAFDVVAGDDGVVSILANGDFSTGTSWTGSHWSLAGGTARHAINTAASDLCQTVTLTAGAVYRYAYSVIAITVGATRFRLHGTTVVNSAANFATGMQIGRLIAPASPVQASLFAGTNADPVCDNAVLYAETPACLPQGQGHYWIVPVSITGTEGTPDGPHTLTII